MGFNGSRVSLLVDSPRGLCAAVGERARELRLARGLRQADLADAAGLPLSTVKRFEHGGTVGFLAVVQIALALRAEREFAALFPAHDARTFDDILAANRKRQRARLKR